MEYSDKSEFWKIMDRIKQPIFLPIKKVFKRENNSKSVNTTSVSYNTNVLVGSIIEFANNLYR